MAPLVRARQRRKRLAVYALCGVVGLLGFGTTRNANQSRGPNREDDAPTDSSDIHQPPSPSDRAGATRSRRAGRRVRRPGPRRVPNRARRALRAEARRAVQARRARVSGAITEGTRRSETDSTSRPTPGATARTGTWTSTESATRSVCPATRSTGTASASRRRATPASERWGVRARGVLRATATTARDSAASGRRRFRTTRAETWTKSPRLSRSPSTPDLFARRDEDEDECHAVENADVWAEPAIGVTANGLSNAKKRPRQSVARRAAIWATNGVTCGRGPRIRARVS